MPSKRHAGAGAASPRAQRLHYAVRINALSRSEQFIAWELAVRIKARRAAPCPGLVREDPAQNLAVELALLAAEADRDAVVWINDVLGMDAHEWAGGFSQPVLPEKTSPEDGLTPEQIASVESFVERGRRRLTD